MTSRYFAEQYWDQMALVQTNVPGRIGGPSELPHDVLAARQKLVDAHALLIGAEALMRSAHVAARSK
jgi:hypothetical protein